MSEPKRVVRDGYDRLGERYRVASNDAEGPRAWFMAETLARIPTGADVLELGCGPGVEAVRLAEGRRYTGVDLSPTMVAAAAGRVPRGTFLEHDLTTLELPAGSFDAVVALYVFGHLPAAEHRPTFARIHGWLRPGGVLCASFPLGAADDVEDDWLGVPMFFGGIGREATEDALHKAGFELEMIEERSGPDPEGGLETFLWAVARRP
jgi:SAM-dependent methyltransferase